jgi:hypothetical protein
LSSRQRNRKIIAAILWFSGVIVFLALAIVFSKWDVFFHQSFYIVGIIIFVLSLAVCRFPKHVGLSFIIIAGFFIVAFSFFFLRLPVSGEIDPRGSRTDEPNQAVVRIMRSSGDEPLTGLTAFQLSNLNDPLIIDIYEFHIDEAMPFVGGQLRSTPVEILQNGTIIFINPMISRIPFINYFKDESNNSIIKIKQYQRDIAVEDL